MELEHFIPINFPDSESFASLALLNSVPLSGFSQHVCVYVFVCHASKPSPISPFHLLAFNPPAGLGQ